MTATRVFSETIRGTFALVNIVILGLILFFAGLGFGGHTDAGPRSDLVFGLTLLFISLVPLANLSVVFSDPPVTPWLCWLVYTSNMALLVLGICGFMVRPGMIGGIYNLAAVCAFVVASVLMAKARSHPCEKQARGEKRGRP